MMNTMGSLSRFILFMMCIKGLSISCPIPECIKQVPTLLLQQEGDSGTISCSVKEELDIREFSLKKSRVKLLQICLFGSNNAKSMSLSGTIENLTYEMKTTTSTFAVSEDVSNSSRDDCKYPEDSSQKSLYNGPEMIAMIWVNRSYTSRIHFSGSVVNLNLTLQNLKRHDSGTYSCSLNAATFEEFNANGTQLIVTGGSMDVTPGIRFAYVLLGALCAGGFFCIPSVIYCIHQYKKRRNNTNVSENIQYSSVTLARVNAPGLSGHV